MDSNPLNNRCPACHAFGVQLEEDGFYHCLWRSCQMKWTKEQVDYAYHPITHQEFIDSVARKDGSHGK